MYLKKTQRNLGVGGDQSCNEGGQCYPYERLMEPMVGPLRALSKVLDGKLSVSITAGAVGSESPLAPSSGREKSQQIHSGGRTEEKQFSDRNMFKLPRSVLQIGLCFGQSLAIWERYLNSMWEAQERVAAEFLGAGGSTKDDEISSNDTSLSSFDRPSSKKSEKPFLLVGLDLFPEISRTLAPFFQARYPFDASKIFSFKLNSTDANAVRKLGHQMQAVVRGDFRPSTKYNSDKVALSSTSRSASRNTVSASSHKTQKSRSRYHSEASKIKRLVRNVGGEEVVFDTTSWNRLELQRLRQFVVSQHVPDLPQFDIIIDDGSHKPPHVEQTFHNFFLNWLKPGGMYVIEDAGLMFLEHKFKEVTPRSLRAMSGARSQKKKVSVTEAVLASGLEDSQDHGSPAGKKEVLTEGVEIQQPVSTRPALMTNAAQQNASTLAAPASLSMSTREYFQTTILPRETAGAEAAVSASLNSGKVLPVLDWSPAGVDDNQRLTAGVLQNLRKVDDVGVNLRKKSASSIYGTKSRRSFESHFFNWLLRYAANTGQDPAGNSKMPNRELFLRQTLDPLKAWIKSVEIEGYFVVIRKREKFDGAGPVDY